MQRICRKADYFFENCFVHNLCPLLFIHHTGKSLTPPNLPATERRTLLEMCERSLCEIVQLLGVETVVGVGKFSQERATAALKAVGMDWVKVETIMHPSPANPMANKGWEDIAAKQLQEIGVMDILKSAVKPPTPGPPTPPPSLPSLKTEDEGEEERGRDREETSSVPVTTVHPTASDPITSTNSMHPNGQKTELVPVCTSSTPLQ